MNWSSAEKTHRARLSADMTTFRDPLTSCVQRLATAVGLPLFVIILTQPFSWYACCKFVVTWCVCHKLHGIRKFECVPVLAWEGDIMVLNGACDGAVCRSSNPDKLFTC